MLALLLVTEPSLPSTILINKAIMEDLDFPICILKTNLQCCQDFASRVKKLLRKVKGVYAITIDPAKGLILVTGTAEPPVIIEAVKQIGQSPQLYAYEKDPTKARTQFGALLKRYAAEERRDEPLPTAADGACPLGGEGVRGPKMMMKMPMFELPRTMGPPGWLAPRTRPRLMITYDQPKVMTRKPAAPYPFNFYETKDFPASNSTFHYFSDDHAQPCTIM